MLNESALKSASGESKGVHGIIALDMRISFTEIVPCSSGTLGRLDRGNISAIISDTDLVGIFPDYVSLFSSAGGRGSAAASQELGSTRKGLILNMSSRQLPADWTRESHSHNGDSIPRSRGKASRLAGS